MKNNTFKTNTLHLAMVLTFSGFINGAASAMGLADAEQNKSLNLEMNNPITATEVAPPAEIISIAKSKITELPDKLTRVHGRTNNEEDKAYYSFTSTRGQRVMIYNIPSRAQGPDWNVEYKIDEDWIQVPEKHSFISSELPPNQKVLMRISRSPGMTVHKGDSYSVEFGSAPYINRQRTDMSGDYEWFLVYFHDHFFRHKLTWRTSVIDSTGHPVEGAMVHLVLNPDEHKPASLITKEYITDSSGFIYGTMRFDDCIGRNTTQHFTGVLNNRLRWRATYNTGYWSLSVRGNDIGGTEPSPLTQMCSADTVQ
jgi:hypothetical protein